MYEYNRYRKKRNKNMEMAHNSVAIHDRPCLFRQRIGVSNFKVSTSYFSIQTLLKAQFYLPSPTKNKI